MIELKEYEILCPSQRVKYSHVEYCDGYVVVEQNRTRRRIPDGYYFSDNGIYIYLSTFYSNLFQHKKAIKHFILNKKTKEWREWIDVVVERHIPAEIQEVKDNFIVELKK